MSKGIFNEKDFALKEYELLRYLTLNEAKLTEEATQKLESMKSEFLNDEEHLNYAVSITKDMFGLKHLNGVITAAFVIMNMEEIDPEISEVLLANLLFEYQDESKTIPLILTGKNALEASYLVYLLANQNIQLKEVYHDKITECVIQSQEKEFDDAILTLYFMRKDIPIKLKKQIIDALDEDVLYRLLNSWEENLINIMSDAMKTGLDDDEMSDGEIAEIEKQLEEMEQEKVDPLDEVVKLINEKLYY